MSLLTRRTALALGLITLLVSVPAAIAAFTATTSNSGSSLAAAASFPDVLQMANGGYTGDGVNGRAISVGFQPDYVIVKANGAQIGVARTSTMPADMSKPMTGATALATLRIRSFTATGFTIGTNASVNTSGATYSWVAFKARPGVMKVGTYTGNATGQSIGTTFSPEYVSVLGASVTAPVQRFSGMTTTFPFASSTGTANAINSLDPTGFTVGTALETNTVATAYHYVAFNEVSGSVKRGTYTGNNTDDRQITGLGFAPGYVNIRANDTATARAGHHRSASVGGGDSQFFSALADSQNGIQGLINDGFELGTDATVNAASPTYHYIAFKNAAGPNGCTQPGQQTLTASGDAWVDAGNPGTNYGNDTSLRVRSKTDVNQALVTFANPSMPAGCTLTGATLRMYNSTPTGGRTIEALRNSAAWTEAGVNYTNQPATAGNAATAVSPGAAAWMQWNVLSQVQGMYSGSNYGFNVQDPSTAGPASEQRFNSDDAASNKPQLILTFG